MCGAGIVSFWQQNADVSIVGRDRRLFRNGPRGLVRQQTLNRNLTLDQPFSPHPTPYTRHPQLYTLNPMQHPGIAAYSQGQPPTAAWGEDGAEQKQLEEEEGKGGGRCLLRLGETPTPNPQRRCSQQAFLARKRRLTGTISVFFEEGTGVKDFFAMFRGVSSALATYSSASSPSSSSSSLSSGSSMPFGKTCGGG